METRFPLVQYLNGNGEWVAEFPGKWNVQKLAKDFYAAMLRVRLFDRKCIRLQRQGRIGTYVPLEGQEAAQVASASALADSDWMFPTYRDHGAMMAFGKPLHDILLYWKGRMEGGVPPKGKNIFPPAVPIATQLLHAAGCAWAEKKKGSDRIALVYFGDGATSEGDFHEGLNFASVFNLPVVFFNQNNGFAISVPIKKQMKSKTIAQKALAYDIPGVRVDGNDVFAVYRETKKAIAHARSGRGPTLIEAVTWRYGAHTTTDDPTKYRDQTESEKRRERDDPILRLERYLKREQLIDEQWISQLTEKLTAEIEASVTKMESYPEAQPEDLFDYVFAKPPLQLVDQKERHLTAVRKK